MMAMSNEKEEAMNVLECVKVIMAGMKEKWIDYVGEFNALLLYLERKVREAEK